MVVLGYHRVCADFTAESPRSIETCLISRSTFDEHLSFLEEHRVEVVTGLNLPMLIKLATLTEPKPLEELAAFIKEYGQRNIRVASEILPEGQR